MLKRQRQSSPPPSSASNIPLVADSVDLMDRGSKRRRTETQSLFNGPNTQHNQWFTKQSTHDVEDDDDEEDYIEEDEPMSDVNAVSSLPPSTEYKAANDLLRELHTLHQHRLLFHTPPAVALISSSTNERRQTRATQVNPISHYSALQGDNTLQPSSPLRPLPHAPSPLRPAESHKHALESAEAQHVQGRYESVNRLLGSLFLSRRRALDLASDSSAP